VVGRPASTPAGPVRLDEVKRSRVERVDSGGRKVIEEPGNRTIIKQDNRLIIHKNETTHIQKFYPGARTIPIRGGFSQTVYTRKDGVRVISEVDGAGRIVRRYGQAPGGRQIVYVDNRRFYRNLAIGVGIAAVGVGAVLALSSPVVAMPRERYIVEYDRASDDDIYDVLVSPPIERLERAYSLEEIRYSRPLRERLRRIDLDTINFELGSFEITADQFGKLERMARAMGRAIDKNPAEVFLIEGHTDAVGTPEDNLSLSDRRAEAVARILSEHFSIPIENLVTQGYGEQDPKVPTLEAERLNRRVAVRRITPMLSQEGPGPR
jgi:outer membrane protein OmpA-like peptidoglycan-associated protein